MGTHNALTRQSRIVPWFRRHRNPVAAALIGVTVILTTLAVIGVTGVFGGHRSASDSASAAQPDTNQAASAPLRPYTKLPIAEIAALPEASYSAVIPGLMPATVHTLGTPTQTGTVSTSAPLFGAAAKSPVARVQPTDFTGHKTVVSVVETSGDWALVLTPSRMALPSASTGHTAPAQTAAWMPKAFLTGLSPVRAHINVSVSKQELTITQNGTSHSSFTVAVGTARTPSPVDTTGYLEARYVDAANGTGDTSIQLTSLHSAVQDEPVGGSSGGLIALHYYPDNSGAVSHGCIRLTAAALAAVAKLPLGTPITVTK